MQSSPMPQALSAISLPRAASNRRQPLLDVFAAEGVRAAHLRNGEIYVEEDAAAHVFAVVSGTVRIARYHHDGKRQISAFHMPGDIFGFEAGATRRFSAEAVEDCVLLAVKRSHLLAQAENEAAMALALWQLAADDLRRAEEHMLLLGRQGAVERILSFLDSIALRRGDGRCVDLPMGRQDIADHLGLTIETVSRGITQLSEARAIVVEGIRRVRLGRESALAA